MFCADPARTTPSRGRPRVAAVLCAAGLLGSAACSSPVDIQRTFTVADLAGGYFDGGIVDGKNRLLPGATFRIEKKTDAAVGTFAVNVIFKKIVGNGEEEFDDVFLQRVEFSDGNRTQPLTVRADTGITGDAPQSRAEMLQRADFPDMRAVIYIKQSSSNWVEIARHDLPRQLMTR